MLMDFGTGDGHGSPGAKDMTTGVFQKPEDESFWQELVRRIRTTMEPEKIILFGSKAHGDAGPSSDIDLFIIAQSNLPRHKRSVPFYRALLGLGVAKDIIVYTPEEVEDWKTASCSLVATVLREGKVLYAKQP
jgi:predicted nucleotidyltransferase